MTAAFRALIATSLAVAAAALAADETITTKRQLGDITFECAPASTGCYDELDNNFQLAEDSLPNTRSAIWANQQVNLEESFSVEAEIMMDQVGEGMAFVIQTQGDQALGEGGNGKGYGGIPCIAVDIDTNPNTGHDSRIRLTKWTPDEVLIDSSFDTGYLGDLKTRILLVAYDAVTKEVEVHLGGERVLKGSLDLAEQLSSTTATWGFTAANGDEFSSDQWVYFRRFAHSAVPPPPASPALLLEEDFDGHSSSFVFRKDVLGVSANPTLIAGEDNPYRFGKWEDGHSTGGLRLTLTAPEEPENIAGGWDITINLENDVQGATLEFKYEADLQTGFETNDQAQVFVKTDSLPPQVVDTFRGNDTFQPLWGRVTVKVGNLSAGTHTINIGGSLSVDSGTATGRTFQVRFDDFSLAGVASAE